MFKIKGPNADDVALFKDFIKQYISAIFFAAPFFVYVFYFHGYKDVESYMKGAMNIELFTYSFAYSLVLWVGYFWIKCRSSAAPKKRSIRFLIHLLKNGGDGWSLIFWTIGGFIFCTTTAILYVNSIGGDHWPLSSYFWMYFAATVCVFVRTIYVVFSEKAVKTLDQHE